MEDPLEKEKDLPEPDSPRIKVKWPTPLKEACKLLDLELTRAKIVILLFRIL